MKPNKALTIMLGVVALDATGIGIVMPVLPGLLRDLVHSDAVAGHYGVLMSLYALMQFACAPLLGALSDRFGRRPVLLVSLGGAAIDYAIMAAAPVLWVLYAGRLIAGMTAATGSVAAAGIADATAADNRARVFGFMSACFGAGLIIGPALGGLAGSLSPRAPFIAAAVLNACTFAAAALLLPETRQGERRPLTVAALNPLGSASWMKGAGALGALIAIYLAVQMAGQVPGVLWVIHGEDRFGWTATGVGLSLAVFGALHTLAQAFATGPVTARLGEKRALILGMVADSCGYLLLAVATQGWTVAPILLLLAAGGVGMPALQAMLSRQVEADRQGQLQGSLAALASLTSIAGPLAFTAIYAHSPPGWSGLAWLVGAALYAACLPAVWRLR